MNCPICGKEMEVGYIQSARRAYFTTKKKYVFFCPGNNDIILTDNNLTCPTGPAYNCSYCKKIVIDYKNSENYM